MTDSTTPNSIDELFNTLRRKPLKDVLLAWIRLPIYGADALLEHFQKEGYEKEEFLDMRVWRRQHEIKWNSTVMKMLEHLYD